MKAFACWSGGKESTLALYRAKFEGINIAYLLNMVSEDGGHSRTHGIDAKLVRCQTEAMGILLIQEKSSWQNYEEKFKKVVSEMKEKGITAGVFGDIDLQEHRDWVERVCKDIGIKPVLPLWKEKRERLLKEFINAGFEAVVIATRASSLGKEWLGRKIDKKFVADLEAMNHIDLCGEKGEYHTFVFEGPIFKEPVKFTAGRKVLRDRNWFLEIAL